MDYEILKTESHIPGLQLALLHQRPDVFSNDYAVLFLHGATFPSALSFGFKMNGSSWMNFMVEQGFEVFALDFLGYGNSDRYPEMENDSGKGAPVGRAESVCQDVEKAVNFIVEETGKSKVYLVGHSWGGTVAALYTEKFPEKVANLILFAPLMPRAEETATEEIKGAVEKMTPKKRIKAMKSLTPKGKPEPLTPEVMETWGKKWLESDPVARENGSRYVHFPSGPSQDIEDLKHGRTYYHPELIRVPTLIISGEWDQYPNNEEGGRLLSSIENDSCKKYVVIGKGTHVMHMENSRLQLYDEVNLFLKV